LATSRKMYLTVCYGHFLFSPPQLTFHRYLSRIRDSVVGIANSCGLDCSGFEFRQEQDIFFFFKTPRSAVWLVQPANQWMPVVKRPRPDFDRLRISSPEVKNGRTSTHLCYFMLRARINLHLNFLLSIRLMSVQTPVRRRDLYLTTQHSQETNIHAPGVIRNRNPSKRAAAGGTATRIGIQLLSWW
jgi:hypothetical protein